MSKLLSSQSRSDGALLARPDGAPAAWWPHGAASAPALRAALESLCAGAGSGARKEIRGYATA